jgi:hypothetical protein
MNQTWPRNGSLAANPATGYPEPLYEALLSVFPFPVALGARQANYVAGIFAE